MVRYLCNYHGGYRIFTVVKQISKANELLSLNLEVGYLGENSLTLLPENIEIPFSDSEKEKMSLINESDVLDINDNGIIYRWYSSKDGDAGIATTAACNSNCVMCPAGDNERKHGGSLSADQIETIIRHMPKELYYFTITGGEPTLIGEDIFIKVLNAVNKYLPCTKILLLTNGRTLGDHDFLNRFLQNKPQDIRVAIPIHGSTPEKHDAITRAKGSFIQTMRAVKGLLKANVELELRIIVSKLNLDDISDIALYIIRNFPSTTVVNFVGLEMRGNCVLNHDRVIVSYENAFRFSAKAIRLLIKNGIDVGLYNFPYCMIDKRYWPIAQKSISAYKSMFYDECDNCEMRKACCGIFKATMDYYRPQVYPIITGDNDDQLF